MVRTPQRTGWAMPRTPQRMSGATPRTAPGTRRARPWSHGRMIWGWAMWRMFGGVLRSATPNKNCGFP
eukprot:5434457-Lingulodinium_polyedra.AAC.1